VVDTVRMCGLIWLFLQGSPEFTIVAYHGQAVAMYGNSIWNQLAIGHCENCEVLCVLELIFLKSSLSWY
jgi:hypothetical protein